MKKNRFIPINSAEAIIEPFWDRQLCALDEWAIEGALPRKSAPGEEEKPWWETQSQSQYDFSEKNIIRTNKDNGLTLKATWCSLDFEWARRDQEVDLYMVREFDLDCSAYDDLLLSCVLPKASQLTLTVKTQGKSLTRRYEPFQGLKKEYALDLEGESRILAVILKVRAGREGPGFGKIGWIGLRHRERLEQHLEQFKGFGPDWHPWLKPEDYRGDFTPHYGFLFSKAELKELRKRHESLTALPEGSPFLAERDLWSREPESLISEYIQMGTDTRYRRVRSYSDHLLLHAEKILIAAALTDDPALLRLAARYGLSLAFCTKADDGMITGMKGSNFEHKAFVATQTARALTMILDIGWDWFSPAGREYIQRRINEECLGKINARIMKYQVKPEEIFKMNQLVLFSEGRVSGYLMLEQHSPLAKAYRQIAFDDLANSLAQSIGPDGSYIEGPGYFSHIAGKVPQYYRFLSRLTGASLDEILPEPLKRTADFAQAIESTDKRRLVIPICDTKEGNLYPGFTALMAAILPQSRWAALFKKDLELGGGAPRDIHSFILADLAGGKTPRKALVFLEDMRLLASQRRDPARQEKDVWSKILVPGNKAGAGHNHEDKGSFVLEYDGETYAMDPGTTDYHLETASLFKCAQFHNMLIPRVKGKRPAPANPLPHPITPEFQGDDRAFRSQTDLTAGWEGYYTKWTRTLDSPAPDRLTLTDDYALEQGDGVDFLLHTPLPVSREENRIRIQGSQSYLIIDLPKGLNVNIEYLDLSEAQKFYRLTLTNPKKSDKMKLEFRFYKEDK